MKPIDTTYTFWSWWKNCRQMAKLRYLDQLVPLEEPEALHFGRLLHDALHLLRSEGLPAAENSLAKLPSGQMRNYLLAMIRVYANWARDLEYKSIREELVFRVPILNPETGSASTAHCLAGKIDRVVEDEKHQLWIVEYKSASIIDPTYLQRLLLDFQSRLYVLALQMMVAEPVAGVIYDILQKPSLKQGTEEGQEEFEIRKAALLEKSKSGKTTATRRQGEPDADFLARLTDWYRAPGRFHRERLFFSAADLKETASELWELSKSYLEAQKRGAFYKNTTFCFHYGRACAYLPICASQGNPLVIANHYRREKPNVELLGELNGREKE